MRRSNFDSKKSLPELKKRAKDIWRSRKRRRTLIHHMLPVVFAIILFLFSLLPIVSFRTVEGQSDAHSLIYWHVVNFFGTDDARGAHELLQLYGEGNPYFRFYRTVVILCIVDAACALIGSLLIVLLSTVALYLLFTEEKTQRSRFIGKLFRVVVGNQWTILAPCILTVIPFLFPRLFAYYSTALRSYATVARFSLVDPLLLAVAFLFLAVILLFCTREREVRSRYNIYLPPAQREGAMETEKDRDTREWEEAVRADAESPLFHDEDQ